MQKEVKLIGFRAENNGIIKTAVLTPDILSKKLIAISGHSGNGKSTLLDMFKTAVCGTDAIKKKDLLEKGYLTEAQLIDGDIKLWMGAQVSEYIRGDKQGDPKFEFYLYAKDNNGKTYTPIIDGEKASASDYVKMLTTELTFSMPDLFSENQPTHRGLIEKLFRTELNNLGADKTIEKISQLRKHRDATRVLKQNKGAFMETFKREGFTEAMLEKLTRIDIKTLEEAIVSKRIERDRIVNATDTAYELNLEKAKNERNSQLKVLEDEGVKISNNIKNQFNSELEVYQSAVADNEHTQNLIQVLKDASQELYYKLQETFGSSEEVSKIGDSIKDLANKEIETLSKKIVDAKQPVENTELKTKLDELRAKYSKLKDSELNVIKPEAVNTNNIDAEIENLNAQVIAAKKSNELFDNYMLHLDWVEAEQSYQAEVDVLRKMYASIDCGVEGMSIIPMETNSGRIEIWVNYNGCYDTEFFHNPNRENRMMFEYSTFQRTIIGLMLQSARLNLKPKALRLAFVDDVAFTESGLDILRNVTEKLNLQLVVAWTREADKDNLSEGQVLVEGGEIFF